MADALDCIKYNGIVNLPFNQTLLSNSIVKENLELSSLVGRLI